MEAVLESRIAGIIVSNSVLQILGSRVGFCLANLESSCEFSKIDFDVALESDIQGCGSRHGERSQETSSSKQGFATVQDGVHEVSEEGLESGYDIHCVMCCVERCVPQGVRPRSSG
jgi:hypothetical protein